MRIYRYGGMWILAGFLFCMAAGCGTDAANTGQTGNDTVVQSLLARDLAPQVLDSDRAAVVSGNTEFALKLFPLLDAIPGNNTFFSPYSITQAFALLAPGARGTTLSEIEQILSISLPSVRRNSAFNSLDLLLADRAPGTVLANGRQTPQLNLANAVWGQRGFSILPEYLDTLAVNFGAGLHLADFINAPEPSRQAINSWVEEQTNNKIQNLIPPGGVSRDTRLVLTNALWFKANWASPFLTGNTKDQPFINRDLSPSVTPFMQQMFSVPYGQMDGCRAVDIPYAGDNLSMLVIMPDPGTFDGFLAALTPALLRDITDSLSSTMIDFSMPKFTFTRTSSLDTLLRTLGMTDTFNPDRADLSGIDGLHDLFVAAVFHQAFISVDELGTEAAAATAITIGTTAIFVPTVTVTLTIDHPFIFLIRDRLTGLILFMGKVVSL